MLNWHAVERKRKIYMQPHTSYLICGTPRSGSSLLCEALINTGIAGQPEEYFLPGNELLWRERWGTLSYADYLAKVIERCTTPNGVCGVKMMWGYFDDFVRKVRQLPGRDDKKLSVNDLMQDIFPNLHYIWIKRHDTVRQAVSQAKAVQTNVWKIVTEAKPLLTVKPVFSFRQVDFMVQQLEMEEAGWTRYFTDNGIQPFIVVYEDFVQKYEETAMQILQYLDISGREYLKFAPRQMKKQADGESEQWVQRYHFLKTEKRLYRLLSLRNRLLLWFLRTTKPGRIIHKRHMFAEKPASGSRFARSHGKGGGGG